MKKYYAGIAILLSDKEEPRAKKIMRDRKEYSTMIKGQSSKKTQQA